MPPIKRNVDRNAIQEALRRTLKGSAVVVSCVYLGPHRAEETAAHGQVQEQVASLHRRALKMGRRGRLDYLPAEDPHTGAEGIFIAAFAGCEREIRDRSDGVQCFAAEAQRDNTGEVVR